MADKRKIVPPPNDSLDDKYYDLEQVASSTDCTGLIPTPPQSVDEEESYADLHSIPKVKNKVNNGLQRFEKKKP